jgi:hypothetical protein
LVPRVLKENKEKLVNKGKWVIPVFRELRGRLVLKDYKVKLVLQVLPVKQVPLACKVYRVIPVLGG